MHCCSAPLCTTVHHSTSPCTTVHHSAPECTTVHHHAPQCTTVHHQAPQCTTVHHSTSPCTTVHHCAPSAPPCTTMHHQAPQCGCSGVHTVVARFPREPYDFGAQCPRQCSRHCVMQWLCRQRSVITRRCTTGPYWTGCHQTGCHWRPPAAGCGPLTGLQHGELHNLVPGTQWRPTCWHALLLETINHVSLLAPTAF